MQVRIARNKGSFMPLTPPARHHAAIIALTAALLPPAPFQAEAAEAAELAESFNPPASTITVTATRTPISLLEAPVTVTVFDQEEIQAKLMEDIRDLVRFEPGVSVRRAPARFGAALGSTGRDGNAGFTIRGLGGNRVLIQVDGIRVPDSFSFGAQLTGRDSVDLGLVKSVEILRGPASSLYGSDGVAGVVSFQTADPANILAEGQNIGSVARLAYDSVDTQWTVNGVVAARAGRVSLLAGYTYRDGNELKNQGRNDAPNASRTAPNPQDRRSDNFLGKLVFDVSGSHRLRLTGEHFVSRVETDVLSGRAVNPVAPTAVVGLQASDRVSRDRVSLDWTWTTDGALEELFLVGYWQQGRDRQFTLEDRLAAPDRERLNTLDTRIRGTNGQARFGFATGPAEHRLVAGGEWFSTRQEGIRDGTFPTPPDIFPTRAFPPTDFTALGLFVADEIRLFDGQLILFPGIRYDRYSLRPQEDPLVPPTAAPTSDNRGDAISPKLGVTWRLSPVFSVVASYAEGFRAPTPSQVNQFFDNPTSPFFAYRSLPNPDLGPERSRALEGGIRFDDGRVSGQVTSFVGNYRDFILQEVVGGSGIPADPLIFQFINLDRVRIHGIEGRASAELGAGFRWNGAFAWARGRVTDPDGVRTPLLTIDPIELVTGIAWESRDKRFGAEAIATIVGGKEARETRGLCNPECVLSDNHATVDLIAFARISDRLTLRAGLFNLTDATFVEWSTVQGLANTAGNRAVRDAFTSPPRNVSVSLIGRF